MFEYDEGAMKGGTAERLLGSKVEARGLAACTREVLAWIADSQIADGCKWLACINPHSYIMALSDPGFSAALRGANWLVPDGVGIVLALRFLGRRLEGRITGSDVFLSVHQALQQAGGFSVFFLGASEQTLAAIRVRIEEDFPSVRMAGAYSPPFRDDFSQADTEAMIAAVNASRADVLWVGMTAPKQEKWIFRNRARLNVRFAAAVGAAFDYYGGRVKRPHRVVRLLGLEWLFRLAQEPRRLWHRSFVSAPLFAWEVLRLGLGAKSREFNEVWAGYEREPDEHS